mmetsp:Transcript_90151/g.255516  ORF Transcript_90151/g.255516 Transcript_90151/m.255516 type:complete len:283 (+) Transcript_90151:182-1030(+)
MLDVAEPEGRGTARSGQSCRCRSWWPPGGWRGTLPGTSLGRRRAGRQPLAGPGPAQVPPAAPPRLHGRHVAVRLLACARGLGHLLRGRLRHVVLGSRRRPLPLGVVGACVAALAAVPAEGIVPHARAEDYHQHGSSDGEVRAAAPAGECQRVAVVGEGAEEDEEVEAEGDVVLHDLLRLLDDLPMRALRLPPLLEAGAEAPLEVVREAGMHQGDADVDDAEQLRLTSFAGEAADRAAEGDRHGEPRQDHVTAQGLVADLGNGRADLPEGLRAALADLVEPLA